MKFNLGEFYKNLSTISHLVKTEQEKNLHPGKGPSKPIRNEAGWACGPVWYGGKGTRDLKKAIYVHLVLSWERLEIYLLSFLCFLRVHRDFFTFRVDPKLRNTVSKYVVKKGRIEVTKLSKCSCRGKRKMCHFKSTCPVQSYGFRDGRN